MHITASAVNSIALCLYYGIYGYEGDEQQVKSKGIGSDPFNFFKNMGRGVLGTVAASGGSGSRFTVQCPMMSNVLNIV